MDTTILTTLLSKAKTALRISPSNTAFDDEIKDILNAGYEDLAKTAGIAMDGFATVSLNEDPVEVTFDPLLLRAVLTYTRMEFGEPSDYERLRASYWNQKAQLQSCTGYGLEA